MSYILNYYLIIIIKINLHYFNLYNYNTFVVNNIYIKESLFWIITLQKIIQYFDYLLN